MNIIAVVGTSGSGKTTTITYLISMLSKEGYKIGSIKHIHHEDFSIDTEGTDTWRHAHAGAIVTAAVAPKETVIIKKTEASLKDLDAVIKTIKSEKLDVLFIEGFHSLIAKRVDIPKIITAKNPEDLKRTLDGTFPPILAVTGPIAESEQKFSELNIPVVNLYKEGETLLKLVKEKLSVR
ncbi:MAG: molybdopterin-guanine dinucleotide biosynthesis protein B [Candidatus Bathyarchaeia archaeon]